MQIDKKLEEIFEKVIEESKKKKHSFTQADAIRSVRKTMPPPSKVHGEIKYKRPSKGKDIPLD